MTNCTSKILKSFVIGLCNFGRRILFNNMNYINNCFSILKTVKYEFQTVNKIVH